MPDFSDTERRLIDLLEVGVIIFLPKIWCFKIKVVFLPRKISILCNHTEIFYLILYHRQRW